MYPFRVVAHGVFRWGLEFRGRILLSVSFRLLLPPAPPEERRAFLRYAQRFCCRWNPCVPVRTLNSQGISVWPTPRKSKILLKIVAHAAYRVTLLHFCRMSRAIALTMSPLISPRLYYHCTTITKSIFRCLHYHCTTKALRYLRSP